MQPCETCKNCFGGCSWSAIDPKTGHVKFEPVKGWKAKKTRKGSKKNLSTYMETYDIKYCPLYEDDGTGRPQKDTRMKWDVERFRMLVLAGMTESEISRRMGGMPHSTIIKYKYELRKAGRL